MPVSGRPVISAPRNGVVRALAVVVFLILCGAAVATAALVSARVMEGRATGIGDLVAVIVSMLVGYSVGVCAGGVTLRRLLRWDGSDARGAIGAVLGAVLVMVAAEPLRLNAESDVLLVTYALCIAVFAAVGFQSRG